MSAQHYFPDSFSCDGHRSSEAGTLHQPLARTPSAAAVVGLAVVMVMMVMMILEEEGAVMQEGGVPFFSPFRSHDSGLPTTLPFKVTFKKKNVTLPVKGGGKQGI